MKESAFKLLSEVKATLAGLPSSGNPKAQKLGRIVCSMVRDVEELEAAIEVVDFVRQETAYRHLLRRTYRFYRILGSDGLMLSERSGF
jgi:DNA polymerase IIIc chi subunit